MFVKLKRKIYFKVDMSILLMIKYSVEFCGKQNTALNSHKKGE